MSELLELVTLQAFGGLKNEINERLSNIEYNLLNSVEYSFDTYEIYTVPIRKEDIHIFEMNFKPMLDQKCEINRYNFLEEKKIFIEDIFVKENLDKIVDLDKKTVDGIIETELGEFAAKFELSINTEYIDKIEKLYRITEKNKVLWQTVNIPYITKFISVHLIEAEEDFFYSEKIESIKYDLDARYQRNYVLCWNMAVNEFELNELVKPTEEQLTYEYTINTDVNGKYLVDLEDGEVLAAFIEENRSLKFIVEKKIESKMMIWEILGEINFELEKYLDYKIYSNRRSEYKNKKIFYSMNDIKEKIESLTDIGKIILNNVYYDSDKSTILLFDLNEFIKEEFEIKKKQDRLYLDLSYENGYLCNEIISYVTSELSLQNKEFEFLVLNK